jgi:phosphate starvation-inducible protein PhoH and related proteins
MSDENDKYYFESGSSLQETFAGHFQLNLKKCESAFKVKLIARDCWVKISGEPTSISRVRDFFDELGKIFILRDKHLDQADFEQILTAFANDRHDELRKLFAKRIKVGTRKREIVPRTKAQFNYIECMRKKDIVFGIGPAGTGKTYLAMAMAVSELLQGNYSRIILTRPAREAGENLGFLPGNIEEKITPYLRPLYDALYDMLEFEEASALIEKNIIEVAPLAFMRGRTLNNAFIILDEAQNTTEEQMLMFLTRLGFDSQCVITGDPFQTDLPSNTCSGLAHAATALKHIDEIAICNFSTADVVRHALVEKIITAYQRHKE